MSSNCTRVNCLYLVLLISLMILTSSLKSVHAHPNQHFQQQQYNKLVDQQKSLQSNINSLVSNLQMIEKNVSGSVKSSQKVFLLQTAITSQREAIFNIQNQIIARFSLSKKACLELTNQQKIDLLDRINTTRTELIELRQKINSAPKCDKTTALDKDSQKQLILLDTLQNTIANKCQTKSILTSTIYQTNIYADGWILGDQHIDDLIEEYYQRNIRYHNITNCPLEAPFFNGQECIKCLNITPVFNILTKQCTICPQDQQPDSTLRQCSFVPHFTNFSTINNWAQQGVSMPIYKNKEVPCSQDKPFFNGKKCEACLLPKYWSIKKNACVECPKQTFFDINNKKCETPESWYLSLLQGTRWVTNDCNITRVIKDRMQTLKMNETKKYYAYCLKEKPYYDGIVCVSCPNQFNVDTRTCVTTPNKTTAYNQNMRCYRQKQTNFETDPRAVNYTAKYPLNDGPVPNCKSSKPYYDSLSCISCLPPFTIFNTETRRCTACEPTQLYDNTQRKCIPRQKIYISTNNNQFIATPTTSIADYQEEIRQKIKKNPQAIIMLCSQTEYSDFKKCLNCSQNQYFNVGTKTCGKCDGRLNETSKVCMEKAYLYTYLNSNSTKRIVNMANTVEVQNKTINSNLALHNNSKICPANTPYCTSKGCTNCTKQSYDYKSSTCVPVQCPDRSYPFYDTVLDKCSDCPLGSKYDPITKKCLPTKYITNLNAIFFYIEEGNYTKPNLQEQYFQLEKQYALIPCDASHPYFNGTDCIDCAINRDKTDITNHKPYFNLKTNTCQGCINYNKDTHKCLDVELTASSCKNDQIFRQATKQCIRMVSNVLILSTKPLIEDGNSTLSTLNSSVTKIQKTSSNVIRCPSETPLYSSVLRQCIKCQDPYPYYNLLSLQCQSCENYDAALKACHQELPRFKMNVEDFYGTIFG